MVEAEPTVADAESWMFPEFEIIIEEEDVTESEENIKKAKELYDKYRKEMGSEMVEHKNNKSSTSDEIVSQKEPEPENKNEDADKMQVPDKQFEFFQTRLSYNPDQVIRYLILYFVSYNYRYDRAKNSAPLWPSIPKTIDEKIFEKNDIPVCSFCGSERVFEFQVCFSLAYVSKSRFCHSCCTF